MSKQLIVNDELSQGSKESTKNTSTLLTERELQCLILLAKGLNVKEVAKKLFISDKTVGTHARSIRRKMESRNMVHAVTKAYQYGFLSIIS